MKPRAPLAVAALLVVCTAHAADIYRWVDENGRTQVSDQVPEKYRASAKRLGDSRQHELTAEQRREADVRAAREKSRAEEEAQAKAHAEAQAAATASAALATRAASAAGKPEPGEASVCNDLRRRYQQSQDCFEPYRTATGIRAEAFDVCGPPLTDPFRRCGIQVLPRP
jgi:hypothetical protein